MKRSEDRILTSHTGSLHMPVDLQALLAARAMGEPHDEAAAATRLTEAVAEVVALQKEIGIDIPGDGEFSKPTFMGYITDRLDGMEIRPAEKFWFEAEGEMASSKDFADFAEFYAENSAQMEYWEENERAVRRWLMTRQPVCVGPLKYSGYEALQTDIDNFKAGLAASGVDEGFLPVVAPASVQPWVTDEHYKDEEAMFADLVTALREEYKAIIDAGLLVQIDDPFLVTEWDRRQVTDGWDLKQFRSWAELAVEALNAALEGLPEDRIRYHLCWGSWNGPHSGDLPLNEIVDLMLKVNAQTYVLEAANARHEWEYHVWEDVKLPEGKILMPGVIEHVTHVVEHPETVADRIIRFAERVGKENVIAGTDCGFRGRSHPQVAWAKMRILAEGAEIASKRLWGR